MAGNFTKFTLGSFEYPSHPSASGRSTDHGHQLRPATSRDTSTTQIKILDPKQQEVAWGEEGEEDEEREGTINEDIQGWINSIPGEEQEAIDTVSGDLNDEEPHLDVRLFRVMPANPNPGSPYPEDLYLLSLTQENEGAGEGEASARGSVKPTLRRPVFALSCAEPTESKEAIRLTAAPACYRVISDSNCEIRCGTLWSRRGGFRKGPPKKLLDYENRLRVAIERGTRYEPEPDSATSSARQSATEASQVSVPPFGYRKEVNEALAAEDYSTFRKLWTEEVAYHLFHQIHNSNIWEGSVRWYDVTDGADGVKKWELKGTTSFSPKGEYAPGRQQREGVSTVSQTVLE